MESICLLFLVLPFVMFIPEISCESNPPSRDISASWTRFSPFLTCSKNGELDTSCLADLVNDPDFQDRQAAFAHFPVLYHTEQEHKTKAAKLHACHEYLTAYGYASSAFLGCAVNFSRPILLCEKCVESYLVAQEAYVAYSKASDPDGVSCQDIVYGSDLIGVVGRANQSVEGLWGDSHCSYCFNSYYIKQGTVVYEFSVNLITFMHKHRNLSDCFAKNGLQFEAMLTDMTNVTNASAVCHACYPLYKDLSDFFLKNYTQDINKICMDVVDVMNQTRRMWGRYFQCADRHPSMFMVWTVASVVFATTIVFYIGMFFNSTFEAYIIRKQDRLENNQTEPLNHSSTSTTDLSYAPL